MEEHIWSPTYGLKGNIDATIQMKVQEEDNDNKKKTLIVPLELKTGRNTSSISHRAQTALYTLLLADRYDVNVNSGLLYYMETSSMTRIPAMRNEIRHMIIQRNELACYLWDRQSQLPSVLTSPHMCGRCYAKLPCSIYHKLIDDGDGQKNGLKTQFEKIVSHLKPSHREFLKHWDDLLSKEESDMMKRRRELWTMTSTQREKLGRCFSSVIIEAGSEHEDTDAPKINRFRYTFIKYTLPPTGFSFVGSQLIVGEPIVVSDEKGHFALANGFVTQVTKRRISVTVDRRLHDEARVRRKDFDEHNNQVFKGVVMEVSREDDDEDNQPQNRDPILYRLDKDEFNNGMATVRNNLIQLMANSDAQNEKLRSLIIDGKPPSFKPPSSSVTDSTTDFNREMNSDQRAAVEKVLSAEDYALILGMPGTGKTTTVAQIIRTLVQRDKTILLTSYTHSAVDNILLKLRPFFTSKDNGNRDTAILRLGSLPKIHPEVRSFATCLSNNPAISNISSLHETYTTPRIVATTCLGITHSFFQHLSSSSSKQQKRRKPRFDYVIIDESSQITLPVCIGPLLHGAKFVLVGDHHQLPPLVQNPAARRAGLDISLFKLLCQRHPDAVARLAVQYRMCEEVMLLSNTLIYGGALRCADEKVARRTLSVDLGRLKNTVAPDWLRKLIDPGVKACFVNTDFLAGGGGAREETRGSGVVNVAEVEIVVRLVDGLIDCGVSPREVGVITVYRSQLAMLQQRIRRIVRRKNVLNYATAMHESQDDDNEKDNKPNSDEEVRNNNRHASNYSSSSFPSDDDDDDDDDDITNNAIELHTPDRFQGRDKEVIILSLVRSNTSGYLGDLLKDWRRINVAFTRARTKLLVVGSKDTLSGNALLKEFLDLMYGRGWGFDLPYDVIAPDDDNIDLKKKKKKMERGGRQWNIHADDDDDDDDAGAKKTKKNKRGQIRIPPGKENNRLIIEPKRKGRVSERFFKAGHVHVRGGGDGNNRLALRDLNLNDLLS